MTIGPGKYDDVCTIVREETDATVAIVIVVGGSRGDGFSVQTSDLSLMARLPDVLETIAKQVREAAS
jgi:hypothetical protein